MWRFPFGIATLVSATGKPQASHVGLAIALNIVQWHRVNANYASCNEIQRLKYVSVVCSIVGPMATLKFAIIKAAVCVRYKVIVVRDRGLWITGLFCSNRPDIR